MATANDLLARAIEETKHLHTNRISRSDRLLLGTLFLNYVHTSGTRLEPIEKTSSGQQKYKVSGN